MVASYLVPEVNCSYLYRQSNLAAISPLVCGERGVGATVTMLDSPRGPADNTITHVPRQDFLRKVYDLKASRYPHCLEYCMT